MKTFDDYKKRIDLSEYAQQQGWEVDSSKSTSSAIVLDKKKGGQTQDTIVVYKGSEHDYFYSPNNSKEKGDIINFERYKNGADWKEINEKLSRYVGDVNHERQTPQQIPSHSHNAAFQHNFQFKELTNTEYLESRGINKATIYSPEFQDRIFNKEFSYRQYLENGINQLSKMTPIPDSDKKAIQEIGAEKYYSKPFFDQLKTIQTHIRDTNELPNNYLGSLRNTKGYTAPEGATDRLIVNTSFPLRNEEHVVAAINRNNDYNKIEQPKANSVWTSRTDFDQRPIDKVVIHESPVDSLSYHQLYPPAPDEKRLYIATAGNLSKEQPVLVEKLIKESRAEKVILANDNDLGGIKQNINIAGRLNLSEKSENVHAQLNVHEKTDARLLITIHHQNQQEGQERIKEVSDRFTNAINKHIPEGAEKEAKATVIQNGARTSEVEIAFTANRENLIRAEKVLIQERGIENRLEVRRPAEKDYNEDLKRANPYIVAYHEQGREQVAGRYSKELDAYDAVAEKAQEKERASVYAYTEVRTNESDKKVELAYYDRENERVVAQPDFEKRVLQQKQQENQQTAEAAAVRANAGDVRVMDDDGNTVAKTDYKVQVDEAGNSQVQKEQRYDQDELQREGISGKEMQTAMNKEVSDATSRGPAATDSSNLKDKNKDINQEQENRRGMSM